MTERTPLKKQLTTKNNLSFSASIGHKPQKSQAMYNSTGFINVTQKSFQNMNGDKSTTSTRMSKANRSEAKHQGKKLQFQDQDNKIEQGRTFLLGFMQKAKKNKNNNIRQGTKLDGAQILKEAQYYFDKNPTYLKVMQLIFQFIVQETEIGEISGINLKKYVENIDSGRIPYFGYPLFKFTDDFENGKKLTQPSIKKVLLGKQFPVEDDDGSVKRIFEDHLPFKQALISKRKEDRIQEHILKCFTFGKKVRRQIDDDAQQATRVEILKKRFQRLTLLRQYFSVNKKGTNRKFRYPVGEDASQYQGKPSNIYDELQYCQESDVEDHEYQSPRKKQKVQEKQLRKLLKEKGQSLDLGRMKDQERLDLKIIKNLDLSHDEKDQSSEDDTLKGLSDCSRSVISTPRAKKRKEILAYDKMMPFDFITQRKAKQFFKEDLIDIDFQLQDKAKAKKANSPDNGDYYDEDEEYQQIREVPELNEKIKQLIKIETKRKKKKKNKMTIKGEMSSDSDDEKFNNYKYAQKVQNTQMRDNHNELQGLFFQRAQAKDQKTKSNFFIPLFFVLGEILERIVKFKQNISDEQLRALQNRQFVIVDMKSLQNNKKLNLKGRVKPQEQEEDILLLKKQEQDQQDRHQELLDVIKHSILKEKVNFKTRASNMSTFSHLIQQQLASDIQQRIEFQTQQIQNQQMQTHYQSMDQSQATMNTNTQQTKTFVHVTPQKQSEKGPSSSIHLPQIDTKRSTSTIGARETNASTYNQNSHWNGAYMNQNSSMSQSMTSSFTNFATGSQIFRGSNQLQNPPMLIQQSNQVQVQENNNQSRLSDYSQERSNKNRPYQQLHNQTQYIDPKMALRESPYFQIEHSLLQLGPQNKKFDLKNRENKIRGYMIEKVKRKSILNCELFKEHGADYREKTNVLIERLNSVLGMKIVNKKDNNEDDDQNDN